MEVQARSVGQPDIPGASEVYGDSEPTDSERCCLHLSDGDSGRDVDVEMGDVERECTLEDGSSDSPAELAALDSASEAGDQGDRAVTEPVGFHAPSAWIVGLDCGAWLGRHSMVLQPQSRALLANLFVNLRRVPGSLTRAVLDHLTPGHRMMGQVVDQLISTLCGLGTCVARRVVSALRRSQWDPIASSGAYVESLEVDAEGGLTGAEVRAEAAPLGEPPCGNTAELHRMMILVRESLAHAVRGKSDLDFIRSLARYKLAGISIGVKYHSRHFASSVEHVAGFAVSTLTRDELATPLPALGIPSDVALVFDGVSIGATSFSRHETLMLIGAVITSHRTGQFRARLLAAPSMGFSHKGPVVRDLLLQTLHAHPFAYDMDTLRARVAVIGGDGAVVRGGEAARHQSSGAANLAWNALHPDSELQAVDWDLFHRVDIAGLRAAKAIPLAVEVHDVSRIMGSLFGFPHHQVVDPVRELECLFRGVESHEFVGVGVVGCVHNVYN